jgi:hypothetical protein
MANKLFVLIKDEITGGGYIPAEVDAVIIKELIGDKVHFAHLSTGGRYPWSISEYKSGARAGAGYTISGAIESAKRNINGIGVEKYSEMLSGVMGNYGIANLGDAPAASEKNNKEIEDELNALAPVEDDDDEDLW